MKILENKKDFRMLYDRLLITAYKPDCISYEFLPNGETNIFIINIDDNDHLYISTYSGSRWFSYTSLLLFDHYKSMTKYNEMYTYKQIEPHLENLRIEIETERLLEKL